MKIEVRVKTAASQNKLEQLSSTTFSVRVTAKPEKGKANEAVVELLADHLHLAKSKIRILRGLSSKVKIFEIPDLK